MTGQCLHQIFAERARAAPGRIAVSAPAEDVSYGELDDRANRLALRLRAMGVGPDVLVGLCADRGVEMIVGLLGILKAGGAYVPIDPAYPAKRIDHLLKDSGVTTVVAVSRVSEALDGRPAGILWIDRDDPAPGEEVASPPEQATDRDLAYVIYTSGSTGSPKGVLVEHRNAVRLFTRTRPWFRFDEDDVVTLFHSVSFDFSVWEIWSALLHGGRLVVVPAPVARSPEEFRELLLAEGVTVLSQTPSAFRHLVAADARRPGPSPFRLRRVVFGGERLDVETLRPWIARYGDEKPELVNMYGITETTVHVTYRRILQDDLGRPERSPIGVPIPDLGLHLLDAEGRPVPGGVAAELYVSGAGLARGYLGRPRLTAERFAVRGDGTRLYRTGDLAVRLPGGEYAYIGRADDQIKVRGFRVEPREIEMCLLGDPAVGDAVVAPRDYGEGDVRLLAFVVPAGDAGPEADLIPRLAARAAGELPAHARPSTYHIVPEIPMTPQGKADRGALVDQAKRPATDSDNGVPPLRVVQAIAADVLERDVVPPKADLFDLGATSLALTRIIAQVNQYYGLALTGRELEEEASVECLASCVGRGLNA
ncbi:amino acid adenylation domain-containing protein [Sphaerisporangium album]|uniref:Amino acid adenylation domain-containing protein n=1 Tax=Sphaerisporangium album TaxID=509200 RepID=A0A367FAU3_9ACTN|nr:amino acid adenylation domain-containing protein [Sphaerisporangium album]RCG27059.1 amino acid adenylation domain-containing protein [Sphaerisporangium album]